MVVEPRPTTRAVLYPTFKCNAACQFCYEKYSGRWGQEKNFIDVKMEIVQAKSRGCNYLDISGGEGTTYPHIVELIKFAGNYNMKVCIITNGLLGEDKVERLLEAGLDDFLVSVHGLEDTHNAMVGVPGARKAQLRFLEQIRGRISLRFNCVINGSNYNELKELATWMRSYNPRIVNFINFNPHNNWGQHKEEAATFIADLRLVEPQLNAAVAILESAGIGVNIRYYPMCRVAEEYRRCVCNDLQVMFDPYEWDYMEMPKTFERYSQWGTKTSSNIEEKGEPCCRCDLQRICGGINKVLNTFTEKRLVDPVTNFQGDRQDFYHYRRNNVLTLQPPG